MNISYSRSKFKQQGFTLIELVLVIIIISVASVPLFGLFTQAATSLLDNEDLQAATQLAQEQAEKVLAQRRAQGFAAVGTGTVTESSVYNGFNRTTVVTQPASGGCPGSAACKGVTVSVNKGGPLLAEVTFLLVDY